MLPLPALNYMSRRNAVKADQLSIDVWSGIRFGTIRGFQKILDGQEPLETGCPHAVESTK